MNRMEYEIGFEENPAPEELRILGDGLSQYNLSKTGIGDYQPLTFFARDAGGSVVGGVHGNYSESGWLYISTLWVAESVRGSGCGSRLMEHIEREAAERGCANVYLDTFSFQAPEFYRKLGYSIFGELKDFPPGHSRIFLTKRLTPPEEGVDASADEQH